jgi:hypothetical protein
MAVRGTDEHVAAGASAPTPPRTPVQVAFSLGWHVAELFHADVPLATPAPDAAPADRLPGFGGLDALTRARATFHEIEVDVWGLHTGASASGGGLGRVAALLAADDRSRGEVRAAVLELHVGLLTGLTALDFRQGKAYGLGRALAETSLLPTAGDWPTFADAFAPYRLSTVAGWLSDLKSLFPAHAADAVRRSLWAWADWTKQPAMTVWSEASGTAVGQRPVDWKSPADLGRVTRAMRRQGEVWRSLLSGEKQPLDLLSADDYVTAGERLFVRLGGLVARYARRYRVWLAAGAFAAVAVIVALAWSGAAASVTAGVVALAGVVGVTWKGIGATLGTAVEEARRPLWDVELSAAVAWAATRLPQEIAHRAGPSSRPA